jgi:hypothetical protein
VIVFFAAAASLSGCGTSGASVTDLVNMLRSAGIECPVLTETEPPSESAGHGSCWTVDGEALFDVGAYRSADDRDRDMAPWAEDAPYCMAFGEHWTITIHGDGDDSTCAVMADQLDGQVKRSREGITP